MSAHEIGMARAAAAQWTLRTARLLRIASRVSGVLMYVFAAVAFVGDSAFWYGAVQAQSATQSTAGVSVTAVVANSLWGIMAAIATGAFSAMFTWARWAMLWFFTAYFASVLETRMGAGERSSPGAAALTEE